MKRTVLSLYGNSFLFLYLEKNKKYGILLVIRTREEHGFMYLHEIDGDSKVTVLVGIGNQTLSFDTKVEEVSDNGILTEPIYSDEKLVGFRSEGLVIKIQVINSTDGKVFEFGNVDILNVKTRDQKIHHRMSTKLEGKRVNRRNAVRVWLGYEGTVQVGGARALHDVIVKDISVSGVSFIFDRSLKVEMGDTVHLSFRDAEENTKFSLGATVVRLEELDGNRTLVGCTLNQESNAVSRYVNEKQREKLRASRTVQNKPPKK